MRSVLLSLIAVLVGVAMVGGGVWGVIDDVSDDDTGSSASAAAPKIETSSEDDCSKVAERDPRFALPHDLIFLGGGGGRAIVQCKGNEVSFTIDIDDLEPSTFYEVVLEKGRRKEEIGTFLVVGGIDANNTVTVGPEVRLKKYDFLTVRPDSFHNPEVDQPPFRAPL